MACLPIRIRPPSCSRGCDQGTEVNSPAGSPLSPHPRPSPGQSCTVHSSCRGRGAWLGVTRLPIAAAKPGATSGFGTKIEVLSCPPRCKRLTLPCAVTQDTEKTSVFLYSKVKERGREALASTIRWNVIMLHCRDTFPRHCE